MASAAMTPPPSASSQNQGAPPSSQQASPAPPEASPQVESASRDIIMIVQKLRAIAASNPATAQSISQINDLLRKVQMGIMQNASPGEAAAPPVNG